MERLTNEILENALGVLEYKPTFDEVTISFLKELKEYRNLEEQGLLLKLPIGIGQNCYVLENCRCYKCWEDKKRGCMTKKRMQNGTGAIAIKQILSDDTWNECMKLFERPFKVECLNRIGKTVFLTKAEAEKALEEMEK